MNNPVETTESDVLEGAKHPSHAKKLIGHKKPWQTFMKCQKDNKIHHAWIISGPKGIGKATFSWKIAESLFHETLLPEKNGGLEKVKGLSITNLFLCRRPFDEKTKKLKKFITVNEIRKLKSFFHLTAAENEWRIALIDCADELNKSASNALLKILEEPPSKSIFLIITNRPARVSATIRSRCRSLNLNKLSIKEIEQVLEIASYDITSISNRDWHVLSVIAEGSAGMAMKTINYKGVSIFRNCFEILIDFPKFDRAKIIKLAETVKGKDGEFRFLCSVLLKIISRLAQLVCSVKYITAIEEENLFLEKLDKNRRTANTLAILYIELSNSFLSCYELNLDNYNEIITTFGIIEEKLINNNYD